MELSLIVVNWNAKELLKGCLRSIQKNMVQIDGEVLVVDNGSGDGSPEVVKREFSWVRLLRNKENVGFARANNQAIRVSEGRYILLLNPDAVLRRGALDKMIKYIRAHPEAGIVAPKLLNADSSLQLSCQSFPSLRTEFFHSTLLEELFPKNRIIGNYRMTNWDHNSIREVDWVSGACMMVRRETIDEVGLLDESIFMYAEDIDWCYRIKNAGWKICYLPQAKVIHYQSEIAKINLASMLLNSYGGLYHFFRKHYGRQAAVIFRWLVINGMIIRIVIRFFQYITGYRRERTKQLVGAYGRVLVMNIFHLL